MAPMTRQQYSEALWGEWLTPSFYRDLGAEFLTTMLLGLAAFSLGLTWGKDDMGTVEQVAIFMGYTVCCLAWGQAEFGGIHMNPSVTLSMAIQREMTVTRGLVYVVLQVAGATMAVLLLQAMLPPEVSAALSPTVLHPALAPWQGLLTEVWLTFYLMLVVLGVSDGSRRRALYVPPIIIGMTVTTCISCGFSSTGCSMNPALTLGPAMVTGIWRDHWVYWVGPLTGSVLATFMYRVLLDMVDNSEARPSRRMQWYATHMYRPRARPACETTACSGPHTASTDTHSATRQGPGTTDSQHDLARPLDEI